MSYEPLYVAYLVYFNRDRDYFECHEVLEELWLERNYDPLYKGLLQVAVGLFHARSGNVSGSRKMLLSALERLTPYPEEALGIGLGKLRREAAAYAEALEPRQVHSFVYYDLTIDIVDPVLRDAVEQAAGAIAPNIPQRRKPQRGDKHEERRLKLEQRQRELNG
ncbi:DUF309 domain-containing protein [Paenibacillus oralis]|uniref:DUF309 domain-containing protein n=1 Tax=Paenibacillus oralis TaxID=2490856 RepID=A0A3P3U5F0_9BACL|nr:DUF309 domain-containing protein [Paenibacillus oralis]RRJ64818.1 DUF309 domain-containing protein [Paenibacillus oralis]